MTITKQTEQRNIKQYTIEYEYDDITKTLKMYNICRFFVYYLC